MSRIGKTLIQIPNSVTLTINKSSVLVKGPKGEITLNIPNGISVEKQTNDLIVKSTLKGGDGRSIHGLVRAVLANHIKGVVDEWTKTLELTGVGYRANMQGSDLILNLGFSHPVIIHPEKGIILNVKDGKIVISGIDKQKVGHVSSDIRMIKPPEPYKGKGIHYLGEKIRRKAGKAAKAVGTTK